MPTFRKVIAALVILLATGAVDHAAAEQQQRPVLVLSATLAGLGIALLPTFMAEREVATKRLVAVLPRFATTTPAHVLTHGSRHLPRRVALVRDHLVELMTPACRNH